MNLSVDLLGMDALADDFARRGLTVGPKVQAVTAVAARNTRDEARSFISGLKHAPHYPRSITYDVSVEGSQIVGVVGPDKGLTQGALGNLLEYGSANNPPLAHIGPAFDREVPNWLGHLGRLA